MTRVRWGVLSTADIGMAKVTPAIQQAENCEVVAIASRSSDAAAAAAAALGIPGAYGSYEALLEEADIDAVYVPLPNNLHHEWTIKAVAAGKHVLCEKPIAMTASQAEEMAAAGHEAGVKVQEAFMYRHHPTWVEAVRLLRSGAIGELQAVHSWFSFFNDDPDNIRNHPEQGGGAIMDVGCYCINLSRMLFEAEPTRVGAVVRQDPTMEIDIVSSAVLEFPGGGQATFTCSIRAEAHQRVHIGGTHGRIDIEIPFNTPPDRETSIFVTRRGDTPFATTTEKLVFAATDQYTIQASLFAKAILDDTEVPVPIDDAIANMRVIDGILATEGTPRLR
ncbi:MAG: Gfo/Idh/MocA family oxidoreductase [Acidimicrobiia bacterium]|nr:MAG: Gfo/Idh/MocA family oxidoreductase [Acidimicrobiia bacterium]